MSRYRTTVLALSAIIASSLSLAEPADAATLNRTGMLIQQCCSPQPGVFLTDGARIRRAPHPGAPVKGLGQRHHHATIWCTAHRNTWHYLTDGTTGIDGWSSRQVAAPRDPGRPLTECAPPASTPPASDQGQP